MENTAERQLMGTFKDLLKDSKELKELKALIKNRNCLQKWQKNCKIQ